MLNIVRSFSRPATRIGLNQMGNLTHKLHKNQITLAQKRQLAFETKNTYFASTPIDTLPKNWKSRFDAWEDVKIANYPTAAPILGGLPTHENTRPDGYINVSGSGSTYIESESYASNVSTPLDLIHPKHPLRKNGLVARVDGIAWDINRPIPEGSKNLEIFDFTHPLGVDTLWHSSAHILGQAIEYYYRDNIVYLSDGPALEEGGYFYDVYIEDMEGNEISVTNTDMENIANICKYISAGRQPFERITATVEQSRVIFGSNPFKHETLSMIARKYAEEHNTSLEEAEKMAEVSLYRCGPLIDLCRGPHVRHTGMVAATAIHKSSASVLKNPLHFINTSDAPHASLRKPIAHVQRVYGISFPEKSQLKEWEAARALAEKSDHRRLGRIQELFAFNVLSPGSAFFLPHGTRIYNRLMEFLRQEYRDRGYDEVRTPLVFDKSLWERSGHWENYKEDMFYVSKGNSASNTAAEEASNNVNGVHLTFPKDLSPQELQCVGDLNKDLGTPEVISERCSHGLANHTHPTDGVSRSVDPTHDGTQALKPMNCPGHCVLFAMGMHSYRDLPLRIADFSTLHRNEISGALTGLTRVRSFAQDDAHIFCTREQMSEELRNCLSFISSVYAAFNFPLKFKLSTRPDNFIGEIEAWNEAENVLQNCLDTAGLTWELNPGDGAFYGPKVDVAVRDALGRWHQCATIQLDFNLPHRFGLKYKGADGIEHTPVMIHRAILGSIERFMAVLLEHTSGKLPLWLSPRQILVCPVSPQFEEEAQKIVDIYNKNGFYTDLSDANQTLAKQVRMAQPFQYNYILIVGANEIETQTVSIRPRGAMGNEKEPMKIQDFLHRLQDEVKQKM